MIRTVFREFFDPSVQKAYMRSNLDNYLAVKLKNEP
jgi:hypothetical protein